MSVTNGEFYTNYSAVTIGSGNISTTYYDRFHVSWERTSSSSGTCTLTVTVVMEGDSSWRSTGQLSLVLSAVNNSCYINATNTYSQTKTIAAKSYWYNTTTVETLTFTVLQKGTSTPSITLSLSGTIGGGSVSGSGSWELPIMVTACTAPTSVSASGIISPNGTFTVSWSGASGGTSNAISGYTVYYRITSGGTAPTTSSYNGKVEVTSTSSSGSQNITISNASRGYKVVCGVVTKGAAGSSYYSSIKTGGSVTINSLPAAPSVSISSKTIASTSSGQSVTAQPGTDPNSQTTSVYYATSASGTKTKYTAAITINPSAGASLTYYFWTYDTVEYSSSYTTCTITKNKKPTIAQASGSPTTTTYTANGVSGFTSSVDWTYTLGNTNASGNYLKYTMYYTTDGTNNPTTSSSSVTWNTSTFSSTTSRTSAFNFAKYIKEKANVTSEVEFRALMYVTLNDGIENSAALNLGIFKYAGEVTQPTKPGTSPAVPKNYNQHADGDLTGAQADHMYTDARVYFYKNGDMSNYSVSYTTGGVTTSLGSSAYTFSTSSDPAYVDVTLPTSIESGATVDIKVIQSNSYLSRSCTATYTKCVAPTLGTTLYALNTINAFDSSQTGELKISWPFGSSTIDNYASNYDLDSSAVKVYVTCGSSNRTITGLTWERSGDYFQTSIASTGNSGVYKFGTLGIATTDYVGTKSAAITIQVQNVFGAVYTATADSFVLNFNKAAVTPVLSSIQYSTDNSNWYTFTSGTGSSAYKLCENMYLRFNYTYKVYSYETYTISLKRTISSDTTVVATTTITDGATSTSVKTGTVTINYGKIGEIMNSANRIWSISVQSANSTTTAVPSANTTTLALAHCAPTTFTLDSCTYTSGSNNGTLTYTSTVVNPSSSPTLSYTLVDSSNTAYTSSSTSAAGTDVASLVTITTSASLRLKLVSTLVNNLDGTHKVTTTKTSYSNYITVYALTPTIAYRKNQLGINTKTVDSSSILDIYPATGLTKILLHGTDNRRWEIILSDGTINMYQGSSLTHSIDLLSGTLN